MLTVQELAALPDDDPRKIVDRIRSQQTRAAASRRLVFDYDDEAAAEMLARVIADARRAERERCANLCRDREQEKLALYGGYSHLTDYAAGGANEAANIAIAIRALRDPQ